MDLERTKITVYFRIDSMKNFERYKVTTDLKNEDYVSDFNLHSD